MRHERIRMGRAGRLAVVVVAGAATAFAASCSGDDSDPGGDDSAGSEVSVTPGADGVQDVEIKANDQFRFVPATVNGKVGKYHLTLRNISRTPHNLTFDDIGDAATSTLPGDETTTLDFSVPNPGEFRFVCTLHESQNQTGTLVVTR